MDKEYFKEWIESRIKLTFGEAYNETVRSWFKGYRKAMIDVLDFLKSRE